VVRSSAASDVYKRQVHKQYTGIATVHPLLNYQNLPAQNAVLRLL
jgi:hypothetical protein